MRVPRGVAEISPAWLESALAARVPGVRVRDVTVLRRESGTNENATLAVAYAAATPAPERFFVKLPPTRSPQRELVKASGMGRREVAFYARFAAGVPLLVPRVFVAELDPETDDFVVIVEDLGAAGARFPMGREGIPVSLCERAVEELAAFHARSLGGPAPPGTLPPLRMREYGAGMLEVALARRGDALDPAFAEVARLYVDHTDAVHDAWEEGPAALVHGDGHLANLFIVDDRVGFFDWGCSAFGPAVRDVSYFVCMSLSVENRRKHERALLERHSARLRALGVAWPDAERVWAWHRIHAAYCVPAAAPAVLRQPEPGTDEPLDVYARDFVLRASAAVADLDAPGAIRDAIG